LPVNFIVSGTCVSERTPHRYFLIKAAINEHIQKRCV